MTLELPAGRIGKYRLSRLVGTGAMGEVWAAEDTGAVQRTVAIKLISTLRGNPEWLTHTLLDEARAMVSLPLHPNLVALHDVLEGDGLVALVMEFVEGHGLRDRLARHPRGLPWTDLYPLVRGLLEGVVHAHAHGLIHRDLKPENVKLRPPDVQASLAPEDVKILDFGLARSDPGHASTQGEVFGTASHMSPEQFEGLPQGPACDQYALGVMLFELLTGRRPFSVPSGRFEQWREAHLREPVPFLRPLREDLPASVEGLVRRALAKAPQDRHPDVAAFAAALLPELAHLAQWRGDPWEPEGQDAAVPGFLAPEPGDGPTLGRPAEAPPPGATLLADMRPSAGAPFEVRQADEPPTLLAWVRPDPAVRASAALDLLQRLSGSFFQSTPLEPLLAEGLQALGTHLKAGGGLVLVNQDGADPLPLAAWGSCAAGPVRFSKALLQAVLQGRQSLVLGKTEMLERFGAAESVQARRLGTALVVPLEHESHIVGLLYLDGTLQTPAFTEADLQVAQAIAHLTAARLQRDRLEAEAQARRKLEREMALARQIQQQLLPAALPTAPGVEAHGTLESCLQVAGDAYGGWRAPLGRLRYAIADVSGKGVGPGLLMAAFMSWMDAHADADLAPDHLAGLISRGLGARTSERHYLTAVILDLEPATGQLRVCNAGHVPPVLVRTDGSLEEVPSHGRPLAMLGGDTYGRFETELRPGDVLLLLTDGMTEATDASGEEFGLARLAHLARSGAGLGLPQVDGLLRAEVRRSTPGGIRADDQTVVIVRVCA